MPEHRIPVRALVALVVLASGSTAGRVQGQVVEFDPPEQIVVDESRLIVTFVDTVGLEDAVQIVQHAGGEVERADFRPVLVWGLFAAPPDPDPLLELHSDVRVNEMSVLPPSASGGVWVTREDGERMMADFSTHALRVSLASSVAEEEAGAVVAAYFPELPLRVERYPNDLIVRLPDDGDPVVSTIESHPLVRHVTYFSADEPQSVE